MQPPGVDPLLTSLGGKAQLDAGKLNEIEAAIGSAFREHKLPGAAVVLLQNGQPPLEVTFGLASTQTQTPVTPETLFNWGPLTHSLTSLLAIHLEEAGVVNLDEPVEEWYRRFRLTDPRAEREVTLRHLLSMTAGIPSYVDEIVDPAWAQPDDLFQALSQAPVIARPGAIQEASFLGVAVGGFLLAEREGYPNGDRLEAFEHLLQSRILLPAGMATARFRQEAPGAVLAPPHALKDGHYAVANRWEPARNPFAPALGLKGSLRDMVAWLKLELRYGRLPEGRYVAGPSAFRRRWYGPTQAPGLSARGMGWVFREEGTLDYLYMNGSYDRQRAAVGLVPSFQLGFSVLTNADGEPAKGFVDKVTAAIIRALVDLEAAEAHRQQLATPPVATQPPAPGPGSP
ncbi:MAG: serine hydrolase domain-containing protein [Opitutales bacterium]